MECKELEKNVLKGEDSTNQFKIDVSNADALAAEIVSFLNTKGGTIYAHSRITDGDKSFISAGTCCRIEEGS